jgi:transcriptional regulator with XRE-family HTH domain
MKRHRADQTWAALLFRVLSRDSRGRPAEGEFEVARVVGNTKKQAHASALQGKDRNQWSVASIVPVADAADAIEHLASRLQGLAAYPYRAHLRNELNTKLDIFLAHAPDKATATCFVRLEGLRRHGEEEGWVLHKLERVPDAESRTSSGINLPPDQQEVIADPAPETKPVEESAPAPATQAPPAPAARGPLSPEVAAPIPKLHASSVDPLEKAKRQGDARKRKRSEAKQLRELRHLEKLAKQKEVERQAEAAPSNGHVSRPSKGQMSLAFEQAEKDRWIRLHEDQQKAREAQSSQGAPGGGSRPGAPSTPPGGTFGQIVRAHRSWIGLSEGELGELLDPPATAAEVHDVEEATGHPPLNEVTRFARALDVPMSALLAPVRAARASLAATATQDDWGGEEGEDEDGGFGNAGFEEEARLSTTGEPPRQWRHDQSAWPQTETQRLRFGAAVRDRRQMAGESQDQVARRCGLNQTTVSSIERGKPTRGGHYDALAAYFGTTVAEMIQGSESSPASAKPVPQRAAPAPAVHAPAIAPKGSGRRQLLAEDRVAEIRTYADRAVDAGRQGIVDTRIGDYMQALLQERDLLLNVIARQAERAAGGGA